MYVYRVLELTPSAALSDFGGTHIGKMAARGSSAEISSTSALTSAHPRSDVSILVMTTTCFFEGMYVCMYVFLRAYFVCRMLRLGYDVIVGGASENTYLYTCMNTYILSTHGCNDQDMSSIQLLLQYENTIHDCSLLTFT